MVAKACGGFSSRSRGRNGGQPREVARGARAPEQLRRGAEGGECRGPAGQQARSVHCLRPAGEAGAGAAVQQMQGLVRTLGGHCGRITRWKVDLRADH